VVVEYPWKVHARPSIEVRLVPAGAKQSARSVPALFRSRFFHGAAMVAIYKCLDEGARAPTSTTFAKNGTEWEIRGERNELGRPAVTILRKFSAEEHAAAGGKPGALAVFLFLEHWAVGPGRLYLELPADQFGSPGTLHVWFLRGDKVLWEEAISWPGR